MENMKINVLGTEYKIETHKVSEDKYLEENSLAGYCGEREQIDCCCGYVRRKIL